MTVGLSSCAPALKSTAQRPLTPQQMSELWVEPTDLANRNLLYGSGGRDTMPAADERFTVKEVDATGNSPGYEVVDAKGREWKVKLGEEVQPEIVASRLLWAIGYHQAPLYYVDAPKLEGARQEHLGKPTRFRAEFGYKKDGDWSWHRNPFVGTRQMNGLLVANLILNNWDIKPSQNRIYVMKDASQRPARRYAVQDVGAALGLTAWPTGNRNDVAGFESQKLIRRVAGKRIEFDYAGRHGELFRDISAADVVWTCRLFNQLTDQQWNDAFRAAHYSEEESRRFIIKLKSKVQEGLQLDAPDGATR